MKKVLIFLAGVIMGAVGLTVYQMVTSPAQSDDTVGSDIDDYTINAGSPSVFFDFPASSRPLSLEDTQPLYIGADDEVGAWELDRYGRESEE